MRGAWVAVAAAAVEGEEEDDDEHEQEWWFVVVVVGSSVLPLRLPDALGVALSGKAMREEEEDDMATAQSRRLRCFRW